MSPEERQLLTDLFERVRGAANTPRDHDAEDLIAQKLREQPYAAYFLAQAVIVQDQALQNMTNRTRELEEQVQDLESQVSSGRQQSTGFLGSLGSLFGSQSAPPPRSREYDQREGRLYDDYRNQDRYRGRDYYDEPAPAPSPWGRAGAASPWGQPSMSSSGGFLSGALTTAAGVAGGVLVADAVRDMFSPHMGGNNNNLTNGLFGGTNPNPGETVVNNFFGDNDKNDRNDRSDDRSGGDSASGSGWVNDGRDDDNDRDVADDSDFGDGGDDSSYA